MIGNVDSERVTVTVALADSSPVLLAGLESVLSVGGIDVVGAATTADELMALMAPAPPRVALLDVNVPERGGIIACRDIVARRPSTIVLLHSYADEDVYLAGAWDAGAVGFLLKRATGEELVSAIRLAGTGRRLFTSEQHRRIRHWQRTVERHMVELSSREREVFSYIVGGATNKGIARALVLSENTVEKHVSSILGKFEVRSRAQLISFCLSHRLELSTSLASGPLAGPAARPRLVLARGA